MLRTMDIILNKAKEEGYGVPAPNVFNQDTIEAAINVASKMRSPIIIDFGEMVDDGSIYEIGQIVKFYSNKFPEVPVALNLDHGKTFESAARAIRAGFTSVMVDRSELPFNENVRETKEICKMAHASGLSVEAEIGHVGQGVKYDEDRDKGLTRVEEAIRFVELTGVDCLAVAIGTAHGPYIGTPKLDFDRLVELRKEVKVPLVLHGGSSTGDENLKKAVKLGISKVNLATDLFTAGVEHIKKLLKNEENPNYMKVVKTGAEGYENMLSHYIHLLGSNDRI
ncbi:MAG: class II fructose-bisphosphate aldolase [Tepidanaerobacteraceae bacterium]|jgi:fructose-bisphosphate aldolase class II